LRASKELNKNILLDARIGNGVNPGVQSLIEGFATGLKELQLERAKIYWLTSSDNSWLTKLIGFDQEVLIDEPQHLYEMAVDVSALIGDSRYEREYSVMSLDKRLPREPSQLYKIKPNLVQFFSQAHHAHLNVGFLLFCHRNAHALGHLRKVQTRVG
jgi:hypothetical protein